MLYSQIQLCYNLVVLIGQDKHRGLQTFDAYPFFFSGVYTPDFYLLPYYFETKKKSYRLIAS